MPCWSEISTCKEKPAILFAIVAIDKVCALTMRLRSPFANATCALFMTTSVPAPIATSLPDALKFGDRVMFRAEQISGNFVVTELTKQVVTR